MSICRIFDLSMPWLLKFIDSLIQELPENLNAEVVAENNEIEVVGLGQMSCGVMLERKKILNGYGL